MAEEGRCSICHEGERTSNWQPFGPSDNVASFTRLGKHCPGFPSIGVCDKCKLAIERGERVVFTYRGRWHIYQNRRGGRR